MSAVVSTSDGRSPLIPSDTRITIEMGLYRSARNSGFVWSAFVAFLQMQSMESSNAVSSAIV